MEIAVVYITIPKQGRKKTPQEDIFPCSCPKATCNTYKGQKDLTQHSKSIDKETLHSDRAKFCSRVFKLLN